MAWTALALPRIVTLESTISYMPCPSLATQRLRLRPLRNGDDEFKVLLDCDPSHEIVHDGALSRSAAVGFAKLPSQVGHARRRFGKWLVEAVPDGLPVGWVELFEHPSDDDLLHISYQFAPEYWGRGCATEAVRRILQYGFETLSLNRIVAVVRRENVRSVRLLVKLGFSRTGEYRVDKRFARCGT